LNYSKKVLVCASASLWSSSIWRRRRADWDCSREDSRFRRAGRSAHRI